MQSVLDEPSKHPKALERYLDTLPDKEQCRYMMSRGVNLCSLECYCKFQGRESFTLRDGERKECRRQRVLEIRRILR